jgi:hypothetical protein
VPNSPYKHERRKTSRALLQEPTLLFLTRLKKILMHQTDNHILVG